MPRGTGALSAPKCPHFDTSKPETLDSYLAGYRNAKTLLLLSGLKPAARGALATKLGLSNPEGKCFRCETVNNSPLYSCLDCGIIGCWSGADTKDLDSCHIIAHLNDSHPCAMEMTSGTVYCSLCNLFIWNSTMNIATTCPSAAQEAKRTALTNSPTKKKKSTEHSSTESGSNLDDSIRKHCFSMRGMINLGNTCFMASVLQVLLHCPRLRDYFMEMEHNAKTCVRRQQKTSNNVCMACELDDLFNTNYSGDVQPFAPTQFLYAMWRSSKNLSGYEQQDAHEFLISVLGQLHSDSGGSTFACKCPVHSSFTGVLQSDVTCLSCGNVNASFDPFIDISLDILTSANDSSFILDPNTSSLSLHECFQMFTHAEKLSSGTYMCSACNHSYQEATKQMSIRKAPEVLTIHLKRFEHSLNTIKIDTFMQFPLEFSIYDYTTEGVHLRNEVTKISGVNASVIDPAYESKKYSKEMLYRLFATVNHTGVVDSGHYISYVASPDRETWFKFDDSMVTKVPSASVLNSNAYMLFYERVGDMISEFDDPISLD